MQTKQKLIKKYLDEVIDAYEKNLRIPYDDEYKHAVEKMLRLSEDNITVHELFQNIFELIEMSYWKKDQPAKSYQYYLARMPRRKVYKILEALGYELVEEKE